MENLKILIADDHKIIRDGIVAMLEEKSSEWKVVGQAETGQDAINICDEIPVDLVIMDINMPELDGINATRRILDRHPEIKILALTMMQENEHIRQMMGAGASGYILKSSGSEELVNAIESVMKGNHYFSEEATETIMQDLVKSQGKKGSFSDPASLTEREMEVLELICEEFTNQEIAKKLFISVRTVDAHRRNLLQKTGARNTAGLVKYAAENNLLS